MRNVENWQPSKYVYRGNALVASRDLREVGAGSRLIADIIARTYGRVIPLHARGRLLDLGCGKVPLFATYRPFVSENVCVDWGNSLHRNEYLDHDCDLTMRLPFEDASFDTIILSDVLEHVPQPQMLWDEMYRVLADHGKLLLNVPFYYWLHEQPHDYARYTRFALQRFADESGFELLHLESIGGVPEIMTDLFAKTALRLPVVGKTMSLMAQGFTGWFVSTRLGTRVSEATRDEFPFGYFLVARKNGAALPA